MKFNYKKIACAVFTGLFIVLAFSGCGKKDAGNTGASTAVTTEAIPEITEIDAFVASVEAIKTSYDANKMTSSQVHDAAMQAMVVEGFLSEQPDLYQDLEYKTKIANINTIIQSIDLNKSGLEKEDVDNDYNDLVAVVAKLNKKIK